MIESCDFTVAFDLKKSFIECVKMLVRIIDAVA